MNIVKLIVSRVYIIESKLAKIIKVLKESLGF